MKTGGSRRAPRRLLALAGLVWLAACSRGGGTGEPAAANSAVDLDATANALENMANELENGAAQ